MGSRMALAGLAAVPFALILSSALVEGAAPAGEASRSSCRASLPCWGTILAQRSEVSAPGLGELSIPEELLVRDACAAWEDQGPAAWRACVEDQISSAQGLPTPNLAGVESKKAAQLLQACRTAYPSRLRDFRTCLVATFGTDEPPPAASSPGAARLDPAEPPHAELPGSASPAFGPGVITRVQRDLDILGYDPGRPDGRIGPRTQMAIAAFRADHGLPGEAEIDDALLEALASRVDDPSLHHGRASPGRAEAVTGREAASPPVAAEGLDARELFRRVSPSVYVVLTFATLEALEAGRWAGQGSAVAVEPERALTNCHVLGAEPIIILIQDRRSFWLVEPTGNSDPVTDRCWVQVVRGDAPLRPVRGVRPFAELEVGERVYSIGAPRGLEKTLGEGIISGLLPDGERKLIQTTAPISKGSSGGGLFDARGNLIGITTELLRDSQNLNFAIAAETYFR